jgi:hypothetical protein
MRSPGPAGFYYEGIKKRADIFSKGWSEMWRQQIQDEGKDLLERIREVCGKWMGGLLRIIIRSGGGQRKADNALPEGPFLGGHLQVTTASVLDSCAARCVCQCGRFRVSFLVKSQRHSRLIPSTFTWMNKMGRDSKNLVPNQRCSFPSRSWFSYLKQESLI